MADKNDNTNNCKMDLYPRHDAVFGFTHGSDEDNDEDEPLFMYEEIEIRDLLMQIKLVGVRESPPEDLQKLWRFAMGPRPILRVQLTLARFYMQREGEEALSFSFYGKITKRFRAYHLELAAEMMSCFGNPYDKEDIIKVFLEGAPDRFINEVPVKNLRDELFEMREKLGDLFATTCSGCFKVREDVKLKQCTGCENADIKAIYCSRECQRRHWHARHKDVCPLGIKYRCAYCKKVSPKKLEACEMCDKPRYCSRDCLEKDEDSHSKDCERDLKFFCSVCKVTFPHKLRFCPCDPQMFRYCSKECQVDDWKEHRQVCTARHKRKE